MPTYQYECADCGHQFEQLQSINENRLKKCPICKKNALHRLIGTGSGIIFKGSGFYETDYKKKSAPANEKPSKDKVSPLSQPGSSHGCSPNCGCAA